MAVNKIYQDSIIAGGSIRDGQGKRIDTTYAKKSDIPSPYTLPTASTTTLGGVKVDGSTITIDNGVISSKSSGGGNTPVQLTNEDLNGLSTPGTSFYADTTNTCRNKPAKVGLYSKAFGLVVKRVGNVDSIMYEPIIQQELTFASGETYTRVYNENDSMYFYTNDSGGMGDIGPAWSNWVLQLPCPSMVTSTSPSYISTPIGRTVNMTGVTSNLTVYIWPANLRCYQYPGTTLVQANVTVAGLTLTVKCGDATVTRYFNGVEPDISEVGTYDIIIELFGDPDTISAGQLTYGVVRTGDVINFSSGGGAGAGGGMRPPIPPEE